MKDNEARKELLRSVKFLFFSISAGAIQMGSFALLNELLHLDYWFSYLISLSLSVIWNFTLNRKFTFKSAANVPIAMLKVAAFYAVFTPLSTWWTAALTEPSYGIMWNEYLVVVLTMVVNFITEYLYQRFFVFKQSLDTAK
jgi:putative flippase GtrA